MLKKITTLATLAAFSAMLFFQPKIVYAQKGGDICGDDEIDTALGCIQVNELEPFISRVLTIAIGIAGGVAFLLIVYAGFMITTSQGNPQRLGAGKELLTAAISGLLFLLFSAFLLRLIGVNILGIDF